MKKIVNYILIITILSFSFMPIAYSAQKGFVVENNLREIQSRTYENTKPEIVEDAVLKILKDEEYNIKYTNNNLNYMSASTNIPIKDVNKLLIAFYAGRSVFDTVVAVLTYGLKSYSVIGDIVLIKTELKDKNLEKKIAINISPKGTATIVRVNMVNIMTGKRDGLFFGPKNRLRTINIRSAEDYDDFFKLLDKELSTVNMRKT